MSFPRYPKYKASGVEWLGEVPDHWVMTRLRFVTVCLDGGRVPLNSAQRSDRQGDVPYWGANSIMDYVNDALFDEPLVLLGEDGAPFFDRTKAVAFASEGRVWPNNHVHVLRPTLPTSRKFIVRVLNITDYAQFIDGSTRDKLTQGEMNNIPLPWPPLPEQITIAAFLDHETAKIDELVAEQERLIELLKEKRQAVISHAVTKGLNPDAPMKDSGIEWLGDVPEHWEVKRLGTQGKLYGGLTGKVGADFTDVGSNTCRFVPFTNILNNVVVDHCQLSPVQLQAGEMQNEVLEGDLLFLMSSEDFDYLGFSAVVKQLPSPTYLNSFCKGFRPNGRCGSSEFLNYFCRSTAGRALISQQGFGFTRINLRTSALASTPIPSPPLEEQITIATFLDHETAKFTTLTTEANRVIDLLKERRTALISAAVTGQIDVRNLVPVESA